LPWAGVVANVRPSLRFALVYFVSVFAAGFVFGVVRTLFVTPVVGESTAELIEAPFMLAVIVTVAWFLARRHRGTRSELLVGGVLAAVLVLVADLAVGIGLRGMSAYAVFFTRDPLAGSVYYILIAVFAVMPYALKGVHNGRHKTHRS
jgi:hypothetical protein